MRLITGPFPEAKEVCAACRETVGASAGAVSWRRKLGPHSRAEQSRAPVELCKCGLSAASLQEALLELQPGASLGWALAEHRGHSICITFVCWPWTITFSANNSKFEGDQASL